MYALIDQAVSKKKTRQLNHYKEWKYFRWTRLHQSNFMIQLCNVATHFDVKDQSFDLPFVNGVS